MSRVDLPLIRRRDHKPFGTLTIIRTNHWSFVDQTGARRPDSGFLVALFGKQPAANEHNGAPNEERYIPGRLVTRVFAHMV